NLLEHMTSGPTGKAVPAWVKSSCCGPSDAHHLKRQHVHAMADGWHIDGYPTVVPYGKELPSEDGEYWPSLSAMRTGVGLQYIAYSCRLKATDSEIETGKLKRMGARRPSRAEVLDRGAVERDSRPCRCCILSRHGRVQRKD